MEQGLRARVPAQAGVWVEAKAKVEAGWADHLRQGQVEVVYAPTVATRSLTSRGSHVMRKVVLSVVQK